MDRGAASEGAAHLPAVSPVAMPARIRYRAAECVGPHNSNV